MYLLKFNPILKTTLWGGIRLLEYKGKKDYKDNVGESWEISGVEGNESTVQNGKLKGTSISQLALTYKEKLLGTKVYDQFGTTFPLLIKFIDAAKDLSIQVHPNNEMAMREHEKMGKTEMWYVADNTPGAYLMSGLKEKITPEEYKKMVENKTICNAISKYEVKKGDVFFIPSGRIHSIGAGCLIAEIQQTSDITYRIYDFDRRDAQGNPRELHTNLAAQAIDYNVASNYKTEYLCSPEQRTPIVDCPYFKTSVIEINDNFKADYSQIDSFVIIICVEGEAIIKNQNEQIGIKSYETVLIPACFNEIEFMPKEKGAKLIETHL